MDLRVDVVQSDLSREQYAAIAQACIALGTTFDHWPDIHWLRQFAIRCAVANRAKRALASTNTDQAALQIGVAFGLQTSGVKAMLYRSRNTVARCNETTKRTA